MSARRFVTMNHREIPLGVYVRGIKKAIANPRAEFKHGLDTWWPVTGAEIREEFLASVHDRINQGVPYLRRGVKS